MSKKIITLADFMKGHGRDTRSGSILDSIEATYGSIENWYNARVAQAAIRCDYESAQAQPDKWDIIRYYYQFIQPTLDETPHNRWAVDPYEMPFLKDFTPIEYPAWAAIRYNAIVMYPQYPALNYFIDFANPKLKVGLELDGKDFHDPARDRARDAKLGDIGWTIYRVPGSECARILDEPFILAEKHRLESSEYRLAMRAWYCKTVDGLVKALKHRYFSRGGRRECWRHPDIDFINESLDIHCTAGRSGA